MLNRDKMPMMINYRDWPEVDFYQGPKFNFVKESPHPLSSSSMLSSGDNHSNEIFTSPDNRSPLQGSTRSRGNITSLGEKGRECNSEND